MLFLKRWCWSPTFAGLVFRLGQRGLIYIFYCGQEVFRCSEWGFFLLLSRVLKGHLSDLIFYTDIKIIIINPLHRLGMCRIKRSYEWMITGMNDHSLEHKNEMKQVPIDCSIADRCSLWAINLLIYKYPTELPSCEGQKKFGFISVLSFGGWLFLQEWKWWWVKGQIFT